MPKSGWEAARCGISAARGTPRLTLALFVPILLLGLPAALLVRDALGTGFGNSMAGDRLLERFDFITVSEVFAGLGGAIGSIARLAIPIGLTGVLLNILLAGGTLDSIAGRQTFSLPAFLRGCGLYAGRFLSLWFISAAITVAAFALLLIPFAAITAALTGGDADEKSILIRLSAAAAFLFSPLILVSLAADYARVNMVVQGTRSAVKAMGRAFTFVFKNLLPVLALQVILAAIILGFTAMYLLGAEIIGMTSSSTVVVLFLLQQLYILSRLWIRVATLAGEVSLFEERKPAPVQFYGWDDSPSMNFR